MLRRHGELATQPPVHSLSVLAVRHAGAPTSRGAAAPVAEDAVAQPCEPPGRGCVRTIGRLKQSFGAATSRASDGGAGRFVYNRRPTRTATTAEASLDRGTHLVETGSGGREVAAGTRRRSGVATGQRRRTWSRRAGSWGGRYFIYRPPPRSLTAVGSSTYSPDFKSLPPDLSFSCPRAWIEHQRCSRAPAVSPAASRAAAAASGDSNKAALGRR